MKARKAREKKAAQAVAALLKAEGQQVQQVSATTFVAAPVQSEGIPTVSTKLLKANQYRPEFPDLPLLIRQDTQEAFRHAGQGETPDLIAESEKGTQVPLVQAAKPAPAKGEGRRKAKRERQRGPKKEGPGGRAPGQRFDYANMTDAEVLAWALPRIDWYLTRAYQIEKQGVKGFRDRARKIVEAHEAGKGPKPVAPKPKEPEQKKEPKEKKQAKGKEKAKAPAKGKESNEAPVPKPFPKSAQVGKKGAGKKGK